jgi:hypothetical protein
MEPEITVTPYSLKVFLKNGRIIGYTGEIAVRVEYGALLVSRDGEIISGHATGDWESFSFDRV